MLFPIKVKRDSLVAEHNGVAAKINQQQQILAQLQAQQQTLQVAIATLNATIRETETGLAAAEALSKP